MANKKTKKPVKKTKAPSKIYIFLFVVALAVVAGLGIYFALTYFNNTSSSSSSHTETTSKEPIIGKGIDIHFLELGNKYTGDSTYIKVGETDILIDAGSRNASASTIKAYIDQYCVDGKLEYVIATHAHQDHIAGFVGTSTVPGILDSYKIDTLIDFSQTTATSQVYNNYISKRDAKVTSGDIVHHYTAEECISKTNGATNVYTLADGITMTVLDQKYYHEVDKNDENNHSVCTLFSQNDTHYLFTGDLEEKGEESLVDLNKLPECQLFKGGHHGSYTANTDKLLSVIKPKVVCICCCAGSTEYTKTLENTFPAQAAINRIANYTSEIYVTTVVSDDEKGYKSLNGNIVFHSDGATYKVTGSNNSIILKDTEWFKANRTWPSA